MKNTIENLNSDSGKIENSQEDIFGIVKIKESAEERVNDYLKEKGGTLGVNPNVPAVKEFVFKLLNNKFKENKDFYEKGGSEDGGKTLTREDIDTYSNSLAAKVLAEVKKSFSSEKAA